MEEDEREAMFTALYLIEYQNKTATPEVLDRLQKWGLIEKVSKRCTKRFNLTSKGLLKCLETGLILEEDGQQIRKGVAYGKVKN